MSLVAAAVSFSHTERKPLFDKVDLSLERGDCLGLTGPSGAGKTTLGRLLAGRLRPMEGRVVVDGEVMPARGPLPVQYAAQSPELAVDPRWTVRRILDNGDAADDRLVEAFGIRGALFDRRAGEISGGELQRVALVRLLGPATRYLICDEVTAQLDAIAQAGLWRALLATTRERGIGLLVISHDRALLAAIGATILEIGELSAAA